jgi:hypothetical protein
MLQVFKKGKRLTSWSNKAQRDYFYVVSSFLHSKFSFNLKFQNGLKKRFVATFLSKELYKKLLLYLVILIILSAITGLHIVLWLRK